MSQQSNACFASSIWCRVPDIYDAAKAHGDTAALQRRAITLLVELAAKLDEASFHAWSASAVMLAADLDTDATVHEQLALAPFEPTPAPGPLPSPPRRTASFPAAR